MHSMAMTYQPVIDSFFHTRALAPRFIEGPRANWRIRARLAVRGALGRAKIGLFKPGSHEVIDQETYSDHHPLLDETLALLRAQINEREILPYSEITLQGDLRYIQLTVSPWEERCEVALVANGELAAKKLQMLLPKHSLWINIQEGSTNAIFGEQWRHIHGKKWLIQKLLDREIAFHPGCFIQANLSLFEQIIEAIKERCVSSAPVLELYAGVGAIGLNLSNPDVTMMEINPHAHASFLETIIKIPQPEIYSHTCGPAELIGSPETLIVDPPRKGCDAALLEEIGASKSLKQLLYLSCSFSSLKRDVEILEKSGWKVTWAQIYDLFPGTGHFEYLIDLRG